MRPLMVLLAGVGAHLVLCAAPVMLLRGASALLKPSVAAVLAVLSTWVAAEALLQPRGVRAIRPAIRPEALPVAMLVVVWVSLLEGATFGIARHWLAASAGTAAAAAGVALRLAAIQTLGDRFLDGVELLPFHRLEREGVYRFLRHPAETGNVLIAVGCAATLGSSAGLLVSVAVVTPLAVRRILREEALLWPLRLATAEEEASSTAQPLRPSASSTSARTRRTARAVSG